VKPSTIANMTMEQWHQVIDVDLTGVWYCLRAVGLHMVERAKQGEQRAGSIVSIMSDGGRVGIFGQANYAAAKTGLLGLTMSAAREWARYEIRVNTISFGLVATPMTEFIRTHPEHSKRIKASIPFGRYTSPEEVAKPICFMLSDAASYITGQNLSVNGGTVMAI
jgi:3-oxoacyl-[acyl-carrier protein] reductase